MVRLSLPTENLKDHYPVVVIGSGYGGGIAASRLARAGQAVCVLERGREFQPGEYPNTLAEGVREFQIDLPTGRIGSRTGLYDLRINPDINILLGCGLGGTSLINANVGLRPEPRVFDDPRWPKAVRDDLDVGVSQGYHRAEEMLKPTPYPDDFPVLPKLEALQKSANAMGQPFYRPPLYVTFEDGVNHVGVEQHRCTLCGDCVSGCNYGAKNTVLMNYLPDAKNHGAEIYTGISVRQLERKDDHWIVHYQVLEVGREEFDAPTEFLTADVVVLAAGTVGSTEILLRSKANGLPLSDQLGLHFSGNGDVLAFGYNTEQPVDSVGFGPRPPGQLGPVGPTIAGIIDVREQPTLTDGMVIEEGSAPGAVGPTLPLALAAAAVTGQDEATGLVDRAKQAEREADSLVRGPFHGAVQNTQVYLVMTHDGGAGRISLESDRPRVAWPGVGDQPIFQKVSARLTEATRALRGTFIPNPFWKELASHNLISVHPMGGCVMAEDAAHGVVNDRGQVFADTTGTAAHAGLYVMDGAVVPIPLGVNPSLTICALAERACALLAKDHGWQIDYTLPSAPAGPTPPAKVGLRFTETMRGFFSTRVVDDYQRGFDQGKADNSPLEFTLTIVSEDLDDLLDNPDHPARIFGTVTAPALSPSPLTVDNGTFNLLVKDSDQVDTRLMRYGLKLVAEDGKEYRFEGVKEVHDNPAYDVWHDTSTLYVTIYAGDGSENVVGKGIQIIEAADFARQMTTLQVTNASSEDERLVAQARFGRYFAGILYDTYGGIFARESVFDPDAPARKQRPLRVGAPEVHFFPTDDGVQLRLTRYQGGSKGPVMLAHGLGVSSRIFSLDTIETNLLEYLYAHDYDVWLLDYRASIELPASRGQFSADDVAVHDFPAAVAQVRAVTRAPNVQVVAHCFGSTTFVMALLAGLPDVRSAVCSQIATHVKVLPITQLKAGLHLTDLLRELGIDSLSAYVDAHADWSNRLFDRALNLYGPIDFQGRCDSPVCHRISFLYAPLYEHAQLNQATHDTLHELFGVANVRAFDQLGKMTRAGQVVDVNGADVYLPHLDRMALPIAFIHGANNECYLPESTEITYNLLRQKNGDRYTRHVIPNYGHIDCIYGKNAATDVYPLILAHLERT